MSADLAVIVNDPGAVERAADPAEFIVQCCERGKWWLSEALARNDLESVLECKAQAEAIRVYTVSMGHGVDARLSAEEIIRRAERGLALAVRKGQGDGSVRRSGKPSVADVIDNGDTNYKSPGDYVGHGGTRSDTYAMTDGVSDEDFEDALARGRTKRNLSRKNVAREARQRRDQVPSADDRTAAAVSRRRDLIRQWAGESYTSRQIAGRLGIRAGLVRRTAKEHGFAIPADAVVGRVHGIDPNRVVSETVGAMEGIASGLELVDAEDLDEAQASEWAASLTKSVRAVNRLIRQLRELTQE